MLGLGPHEWAALTVGGTFPDLMDGIIAGPSRDIWEGIHRTFSHWPVLYPIALAILTFTGVGLPDYIYLLICAFLTGCLVHISCDFFTPMGIPLYPPFTKRVSLRLITTGSVQDYAFGFTPLIIYGFFFV